MDKKKAWDDLPTIQDVAKYILNVRSYTVIDFIVDDYKAIFTKPEEIEFFKKLEEKHDLDWIWLQCHKLLGNEEEAQKLSDWLIGKEKRKEQRKINLQRAWAKGDI